MLNNKVYDVLKWIALVCIPALSAFYASIASVWNLPYATEICATAAAVATLIGALLQISTKVYNSRN